MMTIRVAVYIYSDSLTGGMLSDVRARSINSWESASASALLLALVLGWGIPVNVKIEEIDPSVE